MKNMQTRVGRPFGAEIFEEANTFVDERDEELPAARGQQRPHDLPCPQSVCVGLDDGAKRAGATWPARNRQFATSAVKSTVNQAAALAGTWECEFMDVRPSRLYLVAASGATIPWRE
jgi:hypothetical protein